MYNLVDNWFIQDYGVPFIGQILDPNLDLQLHISLKSKSNIYIYIYLIRNN